ncbi:hypothetical protein PCANC_14428 [Puccinia coronata f. sp. avenae]|uniref:Rhodanese domain-containing protein n=1 Tax=Puccinia coronata f. sp. avenae TaxID=200324 RepID=A0A2N5SHJ0_9BASI|nr:hypothetical protein PCANC_14428 [Puccinia coronata f. sp. avenae]
MASVDTPNLLNNSSRSSVSRTTPRVLSLSYCSAVFLSIFKALIYHRSCYLSLKLLRYKCGGYSEHPLKRNYTSEWLSNIDIFIYFSHHRVSIPPQQWITAAETHHTRILGTLILENDSFHELQLLLEGPNNPPPAVPSSVAPTTCNYYYYHYYTNLGTPPISTYFADRLIDLAIHHQFHGWLINIEIDLLKALRNNLPRVRQCVSSLKIWLDYLRLQGQKRVGKDWEIIWYDSVSYYDGRLNWASMLREQDNLAFMSATSSIFLDYHWSRSHLSFSQEFVQKFVSEYSSRNSFPPPPTETLERLTTSFQPAMDRKVATRQLWRSVLFGVDVFGRGCPYGGGFSSWKAAQDILAAGFSVALFAPGWTWEAEVFLHEDRAQLQESSAEWWTRWWRDERYFWTGLLEDPSPTTTTTDTHNLVSLEPPTAYPDSCRIASDTKRPKPRKGAGFSELPQHKPMLELFPVRHKKVCWWFYTNWSLGSGRGIWVDGQHHFDPVYGIGEWTDMAMSFPKPDLTIRGGKVWEVSGESAAAVHAGVARCELVEHVGWFGSGAVQVREPLLAPAPAAAAAAAATGSVRCLWMNTTSVSCAHGEVLQCRLVWKPMAPGTGSVAPLGLVVQARDLSDPASTHQPTISVHCPADGVPVVVVHPPSESQAAVEPLVIRAKTRHLEHGWIESVCHINTKPFSSPSAIIDRLGIAVHEGTLFAHYLGEISLVTKEPPASSQPHPADQAEKDDLRVQVSWHPESAPDEAASMDTANIPTDGPSDRRLINTLGTLRWRVPLHADDDDDDDDDDGVSQRDMVAWLVYMTPRAKPSSDIGTGDCSGQPPMKRLVAVVRGVQELSLTGILVPVSHHLDHLGDTQGEAIHHHQPLSHHWSVVVHAIAACGKCVAHGSCALT